LKHDDERKDIARLVILKRDHFWIANINGFRVPLVCAALSHIPEYLSVKDMSSLLKAIQHYKLCAGNDESLLWNFVS
jgi:hypothetical protein